MDKPANFLQAVGYHAVKLQPLLPMNLHLILSALFPIYTGAHASICRPGSAAKPEQRKKAADEDEDEESEQKMEGMSPSDAIMLPVLAGCTLAGLYFIIKWLEDPAILNTILNWYFSIFGVLALARLITDTMGMITSFVFPKMYTSSGDLWTIDARSRKAELFSTAGAIRDSPFPGRLSTLRLPEVVKTLLWDIRELPSHRLRIHFHIRNIADCIFKIGPQGLLSFFLALAAQIYFNLVDKPWWLTNALGFSLAYNALQLMSPTTSWTGTLILGALFFYDIYFVFYTPLMVTVATKLDIPAKLVFPRPSAPDEDPAKQALSMLGLGDVVLPGIMIGFALRFDLYLFYLRKQIRREIKPSKQDEGSITANPAVKKTGNFVMEKDKWYPARGGWGERFWTSRQAILTSDRFHGIIFPKTYFHASLIGYVLGMLVTLGIMQVFHHAQPALLYLVPGVLGALWGTALVKGDLQTMWTYTEAEEDDEAEGKDEKEEKKTPSAETDGGWYWPAWKSIFFGAETPKKPDKAMRQDSSQESGNASENTLPKTSDTSQALHPNASNNDTSPSRSPQIPKDSLIYLSITLPSTSKTTTSESSTMPSPNKPQSQASH